MHNEPPAEQRLLENGEAEENKLDNDAPVQNVGLGDYEELQVDQQVDEPRQIIEEEVKEPADIA